MKPPVLLANSPNQLFWRPNRHTRFAEAFFIYAADPMWQRAFWVCLRLQQSKKNIFGEAWAFYADASTGHVYAYQTTVPYERLHLDPERGGMGLATCSIEDGATRGSLQSDTTSLSWQLQASSLGTSYSMAPFKCLERSALLPQKIFTSTALTSVSGQIDQYAGLHRHVEHQHVHVEHWRMMQAHHSSTYFGDSIQWVYCNVFEHAPEGSYFEAFAGATKTLGMQSKPMALARLQWGQKTFLFHSMRSLLRSQTRTTRDAWAFELIGPDATLQARVEMNDNVVACFNMTHFDNHTTPVRISPFARLEITFQPHGQSEQTVVSERALFQHAHA